MEDLNTTGRMHKIIMTNRRTCTVNGVNDVLSFDLREILLETEQGMWLLFDYEVRDPLTNEAEFTEISEAEMEGDATWNRSEN